MQQAGLLTVSIADVPPRRIVGRPRTDLHRSGRPAFPGRSLIAPFTTLSLGAAAIHFAVADAHFQEWWAFGLFMAAVGWFQALWPLASMLRPGVRLTALGAAVNLATALTWAWSRTAGLPIGPGAGKPMPVGIPDVLASLFELALFGGLAVGLLRATGHRPARNTLASRRWTAFAVLLALVVAIATTAAITVGMGSMP